MPIHDARSIPGKVTSGIKNPKIAAWLETGPVLGAHKPIHEQRCEHDALIDALHQVAAAAQSYSHHG